MPEQHSFGFYVFNDDLNFYKQPPFFSEMKVLFSKPCTVCIYVKKIREALKI